MKREKIVTHQGNPVILKMKNDMGIAEWKITKIGKDYTQFEYVLDRVKLISNEANYYVLYKQKIWRAKKCYICAYINVKEKMPIILETYTKKVNPICKGEYYRFFQEEFTEERYYHLFYPRFKKMYVATIIEL